MEIVLGNGDKIINAMLIFTVVIISVILVLSSTNLPT
jgi:hypothetical protein